MSYDKKKSFHFEINVLNWLKIQGFSSSSLINYGCFNEVHLLARKLDPEKLQQDNSLIQMGLQRKNS